MHIPLRKAIFGWLQPRGNGANLMDGQGRKVTFMGNHRSVATVLAMALAGLLLLPPANAQKRVIDVDHSLLKVHVFKAGLFSAFGHDHEVLAPIAAGSVDESEHASVEFRVVAAKLKVVDPGASESDRVS